MQEEGERNILREKLSEIKVVNLREKNLDIRWHYKVIIKSNLREKTCKFTRKKTRKKSSHMASLYNIGETWPVMHYACHGRPNCTLQLGIAVKIAILVISRKVAIFFCFVLFTFWQICDFIMSESFFLQIYVFNLRNSNRK